MLSIKGDKSVTFQYMQFLITFQYMYLKYFLLQHSDNLNYLAYLLKKMTSQFDRMVN